MENKIANNQKDIEKYRKQIFKSKKECCKIFAKEPFEKKIRIAFELYKRAEYLKKFKPVKNLKSPPAHGTGFK